MIPAGEFKTLVECHAPGASQNAMGGAGGEYTKQFDIRAKVVERPAGEEQQGAGNLAGKAMVKVIMRANMNTERITSRWRLVFRNENYHVRAVSQGPVGNRMIDFAGAANTAYLTLDVERGVAA